MHRDLRRAGLVVNKKKVARLMRRHGMAGRHHRRRVRTTFPGPDGYEIPDLVGRSFEPGAPDVAWCQDITYIPTGEGWLYLASVLDLGSRRLLGYSMADHMRTSLALDALDMAVAARGGAVAGVIAHADRGSQIRTRIFRAALKAAGLRGSMGRVASAGDNAAMESFFSLLQKNVLDRQSWATRDQLHHEIVYWIEHTYNRRRRQRALGRLTPIEYELAFDPTAKVEAA